MVKLNDKKMQRSRRGGVPTASDVHRARNNTAFSRSLDWITEVFVQMWLFFGCPSCQIFPVSSASWYRAARQRSKDVDGMSCAGSANGHWFCAHCGKQWKWNSGNNRLLVLGSCSQASGLESYQYARLPDMPSEVENKLAFLMGCTALTELGEMKASLVDVDVLMEMVSRMNKKVSHKFSRVIPEVEVVKCKDISSDIESRNMRLVCEDSRLSLRCVGGVFKGINLSGKNVPEVDSKHLDFVLDVLASSLDVENKQLTGPAERKVKARLLESAVFKLGRDLARSKL